MRVAVVTGPSSGIGRATARALGSHGFHVIAAGRSRERIEPVVDEIVEAGGSARYLGLDLASLQSAGRAGDALVATGLEVDVVVNNAGIGVNQRGLTADGFEVHFGVNHLGHFMFTQRMLPALRPGSRVIQVASAVHERSPGIDWDLVRRRTRSVTGIPEYATSKLANILYVRELARLEPELRAYAVHPGFIDTSIIPGFIRPFLRGRLLTPSEGADTVVWCATSDELAEESGHYYARRRKWVPSALARDDELALELWEHSQRWCDRAA